MAFNSRQARQGVAAASKEGSSSSRHGTSHRPSRLHAKKKEKKKKNKTSKMKQQAKHAANRNRTPNASLNPLRVSQLN